jgi:hypothetical protein
LSKAYFKNIKKKIKSEIHISIVFTLVDSHLRQALGAQKMRAPKWLWMQPRKKLRKELE